MRQSLQVRVLCGYNGLMESRQDQQFNPLAQEEEIDILTNDTSDFSRTKAYLCPLIRTTLERLGMNALDYEEVSRQLLDDIPFAAEAYLSGTSCTYKFSTYFTWFIHERTKGKQRA